MLQVARLAPKILGESADLVRNFIHSRQNADGGFCDRSGRSDLYYTVFGLNCLQILQTPLDLPRTVSYLHSFGEGANLDFVHLCCLARAWGTVARENRNVVPTERFPSILEKIERHRSHDGGFNNSLGQEHGTIYGAFLGFGAYQDIGKTIPEPLQLVRSMKYLETKDGAWANDQLLLVGTTPATAGAVALLSQLNMPVNRSVLDWLLARQHPQGGFTAAPASPIPDLLSTATALHALGLHQVSFEGKVRETCLDFIDSLWTNDGSFHGHWEDDMLDCEYTFYGLLALGHLAV